MILKIDKNRERKLDEHGHLKQKHDLDEIAFAFEKWGKENELSFWEKRKGRLKRRLRERENKYSLYHWS